MKADSSVPIIVAAIATLGASLCLHAQAGWKPTIPRTWDDAEVARHEVPLATASASPKHVSSDHYYRIPVRPIYKSYPVYAAGREPSGYMEWLKQQEPVVVWDDLGHTPPLHTEADWIRAGQIAFESPTGFGAARANFRIEDIKDPGWYTRTGVPVAGDGTVPVYQYVVRTRGNVEIGITSCAFCHTRVMPDGSVLRGAQSNFPVQRVFAYGLRANAAAAKDPQALLMQTRTLMRSLHAAPWLRPDPEDRIDSMSIDEIAAAFDAIPAGVSFRQRTNTFTPVQVPDLIGVKDRRYLDRTGLEMHRSVGDMMRYAAMNQGADALATYAGFVPADSPRFTQVPPPERSLRYADEQLYALSLYVYSLQPPPNPNRFDDVAARGRQVFDRERCANCHTPPLYTNNMLTPAPGFEIPADHEKKFDILRISVGTDPDLTMKTRRGTGYYKVPSLKGVWYRSMFGHSGWCATLEDWFDPHRLDDDYVPTGFKGYQVTHRAVPGHPFGLKLSADDKRSLIAFLRTL
jgi:mono/diheme cytochrome c family protein